MPVKLPTMGGGSGSVGGDLYNFPITFSSTQPTPIRSGHLWVSTLTDGDITQIQILESLNTNAENGTLMIIVGDLVYRSFKSVIEKKTTNGSKKTFTIQDKTFDNADWLVNYIDENNYYSINKPYVYSKINGVLDIETTYMWNGTQWVLICEKNSYLFNHTTRNGYYEIASWNKVGDTYIPLTGTNLGTASGLFQPVFSIDGQYVCSTDYSNKSVYKRIGDVWELYWTTPNSLTFNDESFYSISSYMMTRDGNYIFALAENKGLRLIAFKNTGSGFEPISASVVENTSEYHGGLGLYCNWNGSAVAVIHREYTSSISQASIRICVRSGDGYIASDRIQDNSSYSPYIGGFDPQYTRIFFSTNNEFYIIARTGTSDYRYGVGMYSYDPVTANVSRFSSQFVSTTTDSYIYSQYGRSAYCDATKMLLVFGNGYSNNGWTAWINNKKVAVSIFQGIGYYTHRVQYMAVNSTGDRMVITAYEVGASYTTYYTYICSVEINDDDSVTIKKLDTLYSGTTYPGEYCFAPGALY